MYFGLLFTRLSLSHDLSHWFDWVPRWLNSFFFSFLIDIFLFYLSAPSLKKIEFDSFFSIELSQSCDDMLVWVDSSYVFSFFFQFHLTSLDLMKVNLHNMFWLFLWGYQGFMTWQVNPVWSKSIQYIVFLNIYKNKTSYWIFILSWLCFYHTYRFFLLVTLMESYCISSHMIFKKILL